MGITRNPNLVLGSKTIISKPVITDSGEKLFIAVESTHNCLKGSFLYMLQETIEPSLFESVRQYDGHILQYIQSEASHGLSHALEAADLTFSIAQEPEYKGKLTTGDFVVMRHAGTIT